VRQVAPQTYVVEGAQLSVRRAGSGPPLLFLHGSESFASWQPFMDVLAERFEVIVPDHPGFGLSETPSWLDEIDDLVHAYRSFIEQLGLSGIVLVGHGIGGWIASELALLPGVPIRSLVLVDSAGLPPVVDGVDPFMCTPDEQRRKAYADTRRASQSDPRSSEIQARDQLMVARLAWQPRFYSPRLAKWLHRLRVPTLIVWGKDDVFFPVQQADAFARAIESARVNVIGDAGHLPHIEQPQAFTSAIVSFVT